MMRMSKALGSLVAMAAAVVALSTATDARADGEFAATGGTGSITVASNGPWHINKDGPWAATVGGTTLDKTKWKLDEKSATISGVPAGAASVKVYVCNGATCLNKTINVTVK
jgi:hypothetical protein